MKRMRRILVRSVAALVLLLVGGFIALQTPAAQSALFSLVASLASTPDNKITLSAPSGFFPTDMTLGRIEVADSAGVWLTADQAHVDWEFAPLLQGRLVVTQLAAQRVEMTRPPLPPREAAPAEETPQSSDLRPPLSVEVRALEVRSLQLSPVLTGVASTWTVGGSAVADRTGTGRIDLKIDRSDGPNGALKIGLAFDAGHRTIDGSVDFQEGPGGIAAGFMSRPDLGTLTVRMTLKGGDGEGQADFVVANENAISSRGKAVWRREAGATSVNVDVTGEAPGLRDSAFARLVRTPFKLTAEARVDATALTLSSLHLEGAPATLDGTARLERAGDKVTGELTIQIGEDTTYALLLPGFNWSGLKAHTKLEGSLAHLSARTAITASSLIAPGPVTIRDLDLGIDLTAEQLRQTPILRAHVTARTPSLALPPVQGHSLPSDRIDLVFDVARSATGAIRVDGLDLKASLLNATGRGSMSADRATHEGDVVLEVPDLKPFSEIVGETLAGRLKLSLAVRPGEAGATSASWQLALSDARLPQVPPGLLAPQLTSSGTFTADRSLRWKLAAGKIAGEAFTVDMSGTGERTSADVIFSADISRLAAIAPELAGQVSAKGKLGLNNGRLSIVVAPIFTDLSMRGVQSRKLDVSAEAIIDRGNIDARLDARGDLAGQRLTLSGSAAMAEDGSISVPLVDGSWASATAKIRDISVRPGQVAGSGRIRIEHLEDFAKLAGTPMGGNLEIDIDSDPAVAAGRLIVALRGKDLVSGARRVGELAAQGSLADPFGTADLQAKMSLKRVQGFDDLQQVDIEAVGTREAVTVTVNGSGARTSIATKARVIPRPEEITIELASLDARYAGERTTLAAPTTIRIANGRTTIAPASLSLSSGRVRIAGSIDPQASDLSVDISALPLAVLAALSPDAATSGTLDARIQIRGPASAPQISANYTARDIRARIPQARYLPPASVTGTATLQGNAAQFDARLVAGNGNALTLKGTATLPSGGAALQARVSIVGGVDMALVAPLLGPNVRGVAGKLQSDVTANIVGERISASGTLTLSGATLAIPSQGTRLEGGEGLIRLADDLVTIERLVFRTPGRGEITVSGTVRLDPGLSLPTQLRVVARNALLANRPDTLLALSSDLRLEGTVRDGLSLDGTVTVDKAELSIAGGGKAARFPTIPVREINVPANGKGPPQVVEPAAASGTPIKLNIVVDAPRGVFVRGRGLDAELSGRFTVTGDSNRPVVLGGTQIRRGTFNLVGQRLNFARGNVTLANADKLEPALDFLATTRNGGTEISVEITGTPAAPKIALSSKPSLPPDEIMSMLLFGKATSTLSPFEVAQVVSALAELTGTVSSGGVFDQVRRGLGLDRLGVSSDPQPGAKPGAPPVMSVEGGRYVSPGIYVGAKQGAQAGSSRGVVEVEVLPHTKIEGDFGSDATGRVGVKMEWDY